MLDSLLPIFLHFSAAPRLWRDYFRPHGRAVLDRCAPSDFERQVRRVVRWLKKAGAKAETTREEASSGGLMWLQDNPDPDIRTTRVYALPARPPWKNHAPLCGVQKVGICALTAKKRLTFLSNVVAYADRHSHRGSVACSFKSTVRRLASRSRWGALFRPCADRPPAGGRKVMAKFRESLRVQRDTASVREARENPIGPAPVTTVSATTVFAIEAFR